MAQTQPNSTSHTKALNYGANPTKLNIAHKGTELWPKPHQTQHRAKGTNCRTIATKLNVARKGTGFGMIPTELDIALRKTKILFGGTKFGGDARQKRTSTTKH
jgi:hypothetical protein